MMDKIEWNNYLRTNRVGKIAVWGTGYHAQNLIEMLGTDRIECVLDSYQSSGKFHNIDIRNLTDAMSERKIDLIIIAAEMGQTLIIFRWIKDICEKHAVAVYDKDGRNLFAVFKQVEEKKIHGTEEILKREIDCHEVISFDLFDTLIMRQTLYPEDVFELVEEKAKKEGICVENLREVRKEAEQSIHKASPNIYEIYERLVKQQLFTKEEADRIQELELATERAVLIPRKKMVEIFQYAKGQKKPIVLISDMYLPKKILRGILDNLQITGYQDLMVSCDYQETKYGKIFEIYKDKYPEKSYLHIGDNEEADGICAQAAGLDYFLIPKAIDMLIASSCKEILDSMPNINERSMIGLFIARIFNNPFAEFINGKPIVATVQDTAYDFFAPFLTGFMLWFLEELQKEKCNGILFSARDGFLIQKLYRAAKEMLQLDHMPADYYFYTSRMISIFAGIKEPCDIEWMLSPPVHCSWEEVLRERFYLEKEEIKPADGKKYDDIFSYAMAHEQVIYQRAKQARDHYLRYIEQIGITDTGDYVFFDFVSCGTCQFYLKKYMPFLMKGYYVGFYEPVSGEKRELEKKAWVYNVDYYEKETFFFANYLLLEYILTSDEPTVKDFDGEGNPIFAKEERTRREMEEMEQIHHVIVAYFKKFLSEFWVGRVKIRMAFLDKLLKFYGEQYTKNNSIFFSKVVFVDDFGKNMIRIEREAESHSD